ncbi:MAG TPA: polysaccharide deacetylase family protein [Candidatus Limnocylindria bacterium]
MSIRAKGIGGYAVRAAAIAWRFKVGQGLANRSLRRYVELTRAVNAYPSLPVTAVVLRRHPRLIAEFAAQGVEFAIHGLVHNDHAVLGLEQQLESIARAARYFGEARIPFTGFRGPYLRYSGATDVALRALGIRYHSSQGIHFPVLSDAARRADGYRRALAFYGSWDADRVVSRPRFVDGLVHIPVSLPDDEMMIERLRLSHAAQIEAWKRILATTYRDGELFTVMLHPERIFECGEALAAVLAEARSLADVWIARLDEIAEWWHRRSAVKLEVREISPGRFSAVAVGALELALVLSRQGTDHALGKAGQAIEFCSGVRPWVGVDESAPDDLVAFLREEGYLVERSAEKTRFATFIRGGDWSERGVLAQLEGSAAPIVRVARWPTGVKSALAVTGDIDSLTLGDFALRIWETR